MCCNNISIVKTNYNKITLNNLLWNLKQSLISNNILSIIFLMKLLDSAISFWIGRWLGILMSNSWTNKKARIKWVLLRIIWALVIPYKLIQHHYPKSLIVMNNHSNNLRVIFTEYVRQNSTYFCCYN